MATSRRKTHYTVSRFRGRQQAARHRRFCILWINRMVNKQVEKQIAELREEIFLMNLELRVQMAAELKEHLGEAVVTQTRETPKPYSAFDTEETETRQLKNDEGKEKMQSKEELNCSHSETRSSERLYPKHLSSKPDQGFRMCLSMVSQRDSMNREIRHTDIKHLPSEDYSASQQAQCGPISPSGDPAVCDSCKLMEKSEEKKSPQNPSQMFTVREESIGDKAKAEHVVLMKTEWKEWLNKKEIKGNKRHENQRNVQLRAMGPGASEKQMTKTKKSGQIGTMKKITTYLSEFFNPSDTSKWEILEEED